MIPSKMQTAVAPRQEIPAQTCTLPGFTASRLGSGHGSLQEYGANLNFITSDWKEKSVYENYMNLLYSNQVSNSHEVHYNFSPT